MASGTEASILTVAAASAGICTGPELAAVGVSERTVRARVASGSLVRLADGLFEVPAMVTERTPLYRAARANPAGALSHGTAARQWGFAIPPASSDDPVEITVPFIGNARSGLSGVVIHRARRWSPDDLASPRAGLVATTPARTIVDLAGTSIGDRRLQYVIQDALVQERCSLDEVADCLGRVGGRGVAGSGRLRRLLIDLGGSEPMPQSELERRLIDLLDDRFRRQFRPPWYDGIRGVVDLADPASRTIVEADGRRWHATEQAMVEDRRRDRAAAANGWLVVRVTWDDVVQWPEATMADIEAIVGRRSRPAA